MSGTAMSQRPPVIAGMHPLRLLGTGGFADVYLYRQDRPNRNVAVKVLKKEMAGENRLQMFNDEADAMALLSAHPSILTIYQAGVSADGYPYLVLEYCPSSFAQEYREVFLPIPDCLNVGIRIAGAVETAHRSKILHRDIKPSNVLVTEFGIPVLSDFGIATILGGSQEDVGAMSPQWTAPEVLDNKTTGSVAADVWGLSATVYALLAGRNPFELADASGDTKAKFLDRIRRAEYVPTGRADVPSELERLLRRGLSKDPSERHSSAAIFAQDLRRVQESAGFSASPLEFYAAKEAVQFAPPTHTRSQIMVEPPAPRTKRPKTEKPLQPVKVGGRTFSSKWVAVLVAGATLLTAALMLGLGSM